MNQFYKNSKVTLIFGLLFLLNIWYQMGYTQDFYDCGTDILHQKRLQTDIAYMKAHNTLNAETYRLMSERPRKIRAVQTIPVVVHIIHLPGTPLNTGENISNLQVITAISHLNDAFRKQGVYAVGANAVDTEISFCLAQRDINGNSTDGIEHIPSNLSNLDMSQDAVLKALTQSPNLFPSTDYMNIWIVKDICNGANCNVAGYSTLAASHGSALDGFVCEANYFGTSTNNSKVAVHEIGHYLNLYHTFQNTGVPCVNNDCLADGDQICDTPPDNSYFTCNVSNTCNTDVNILDPNNPFMTNQNDMIENYMDYSGLGCMNTFTANQKMRMKAALNGIRASLLTSQGCEPVVFCGVTAGFISSATSVLLNTTITFNNTSTGATSYEWKINGMPFSTAANTSYLFSNAGAYEICLTSTNGGCTTTQCQTITVNSLIITPIGSYLQAITNLVGNNLQISNISINCNTSMPTPSIANYNAGLTNIGLTQGIILTSGSAYGAIGPDNSSGAGICVGTLGDALLDNISSAGTYDACTIEFDIVPNCDTLRVKYMFGSEEYPEFVDSYNDIFAFFITGPGFAPNTNIALIPGTNNPVSIYNVNNGTGNVGPCVNCAYYVDNTGGVDIQYDGHTTILQAKVGITLGASYHLKIAIADAGDCSLDSGVFLEADGITCNTPPWGPLAIAFSDFAAVLTQKNPYSAKISWKVNSNEGVFDYEVQRKMANEKDFVAIGNMAVADTNYAYQDAKLLPNQGETAVQYRIKAIDFNGGYTFSEIENIYLFDEKQPFSAITFPNPANDRLILQLSSTELDASLQISLANSMGVTSSVAYARDFNNVEIDISDFAEGVYYLILINGNGDKWIDKLVIIRK